MNFQEIRKKYPEYNDMDDNAFAKAFHSKFYSDLPFEDFSKKVGLVTPPKKAEDMKAPTYMGIPEAAVSMVAGLPSMIAGGVGGTLAGIYHGVKEGSIDKGYDAGAEVSKAIQESNFGLGAYQGTTDPGKRAVKKAGEWMAMPGEAAGEYIGAPLGKLVGKEEEGRFAAKLGTDVALNFLPLHLGVTVPLKAGAKAIDKLTAPKDKTTSQIKSGLDEFQATQKETAASVVPESSTTPDVMRVTPEGQAYDPAVEMFRQKALEKAEIERTKALKETPLEFESPYPVKADDYPNVLKDEPYQYEGGIDYTLPRDEAALPIEVADILRTGERAPDPFNRYSPNQAARRILEEGEKPPIIKTNRRGQEGALDFEAIVELFPRFKNSKVKVPVYHGTTKEINGEFKTVKGFKDFYNDKGGLDSEGFINAPRRAYPGDLGIWFGGTPRSVDTFAGSRTAVKGGNIHQSYINLENPKEFATHGDFIDWFQSQTKNGESANKARRQLIKEGHDGIAIKESMTDGGGLRSDYVAFNPEQIKSAISPVNTMKRGQRGGLDIQEIGKALESLRARFGAPKDSLATPTSPEMIAAKQTQRVKAEKAASIIKERLPEYYDPQTFEEAAALSRDAKDIKSNPYTRGTAPGNNFMATYHNNPLLKYMRKVINDARGAASEFSRTYVTGENGVSPAIVALNGKEKVQVAELLTELDRRQIDWTPEMSEKLGLSPAISKYMDAHKKAMDAQWEWHLKNTGAQGLNIARKRRGYSPSVFEGTYNSLVLVDGKPVGVISVDSPGEFMKAKEYYSKKNPSAKFSADTWQQARRGFSGGNASAFKYRDLGAMIDLLAKADGDFSKVQMKVDQEILRASSDLFNFNVHNLNKSGVEGNLGNKGWLSPEKNAQQRLDSVVKFLEEAAEHHSLQKPMEELRLLMADDNTKNLTNTKEYMDDYMKNISGSYLNNAGKIINAAFDGLHGGLVESVAAHIPGVRNYVGPGNTLKLSNFVKNKMSQMYMGWFNWTFTASQFMQPIQTGAPILEMVSSRLGLPMAEASKSLAVGGGDFVKAQLYRMGIIDKLDPRVADAVDWAEKRGLLDFTELERAYEGNKTKAGRMLDKAAELNMKIGENSTRPPMFLAFVDMVSKVEPDKIKAYEIAENLTNQAMADYHKYERPLMYTGMGVLSPHVGGLTTFKHNFAGTQVLLGKNAAKAGLRNKAPLAMSAMTMLMLGGITGTMFYNEFNTIYEYLREKYSGEKRSIAQDMLGALPQYMKTGVASSILDLNVQGKFSSADMIPDTFAKAAFPHLSGAYDIAASAYDAARNPDQNTLGNLAVATTPSGLKQASRYAFKRDEEGNLLNKQGQVEAPRTEEQWKRSIISGLVPLDEAVKSQKLFQNRSNEKARMERMTQLSQKFKAAVLAGEDPDRLAEILNDYEEIGGVGQTLIQQIPKIQQEAAKTAQERAEGMPKSRQAIKRYEAYQN